MKNLKKTISASLMMLGICSSANAQLSANPDKFLGNITTSYNVDFGNEKYYTLWNQITPENESKWASIEGGARGSFNWGGCDNAYNYAKKYNFPFKFHTLIWGSQYPGWMDHLSTQQQYKAIEEWMDAIKKRYPDLPLIDVVNEAVAGHAPAPYKEALGGDGKTGYDWIIKAFEMAHERWPDAILIYNDFNTFQWQRQQFIDLVRTLRDAGAPVDAYGCQSHDLTDMNVTDFKAAMTEIQNALKMPMYSTEYDIGTSDDKYQLQRYKEQIPYMWESSYCAGVTLWGYIYGRTWTTDGNSGIIKDGKDRPAMEWLRQYMKTDAAKNAKSPFPGMKKEASVYVRPASIRAMKGEVMPITIDARLRTKEIEKVELYVKSKLVATLTESPYSYEYTPTALGRHDMKAVVYASDGTKYERYGGFSAFNPRKPFKEMSLPGIVQAEDFDISAEGMTYHDSESANQGGTNYRTDGSGVDVVTCTGGYAVGYTVTGEWMEYTVDVKEAGLYSYDAYVSAGSENTSISLSLSTDEGLTPLSGTINVPCVKANSWDTYKAVHGRTLIPLEAGKQIIRINITSGNCNVDKVVFKHLDVDSGIKVAIASDPKLATVNEYVKLSVTASSPTSTIEKVNIYVGDILLKSLSAEPFETNYRPTAKGKYVVTAEAFDADGKVSKVVSYTLTVNNKRTPYKGVVNLPGVVQAENFDKGGEGLTFHDSDAKDEGDAKYRTDNEGVDIVKCTGGYALGYVAANEWTEYTVNVTDAGKYRFEATVSCGSSEGCTFTIALVKDGKASALARATVPKGTDWNTYKVVKGTFIKNIEEGEQIFRIVINSGSCNIDKIDFICSVSTDIDGVEDSDDAESSDEMYNLSGQKVNASYKGVVIRNGKKYLNR